MAEQLSDLDSGTLDASTKLDKAKNVEDPIRSPHHIDLSRTKSINPRKSPKQESKTDYSDNPKEFRRDFSNKELDLSGCDFKKFPKGFKYCPDLEELNLSNNPRIHLDISSLKIHKYCLKKLNLSGCGLTKLPKGFRFCRILEELNLSNNPLSHSDISFFELSKCSLKNLDLSGCDLTKLPEGLKDCHKLEELNLSNNPLSHSDISFLELSKCSLKKLDLSGCGLTELPKDSEECRKLEELNFSNNSFDHQDLLEKLISGKVFSLGLHQSDRERFKFTDTGGDLFMLSKPTCRIIFEDAIYTQSAGG
jgi:Leucine-rich repeat (LRR) protein